MEQEKASTVASLNIPGQDWRRTPPVAGPQPKFELPVPTQFKLENGLTVLLVEQHNLPLVAARLVALGGSGGNPADKPGLAGFTAAMMNEGTTHRSALELADDVNQLGAKLETDVTPDVSFVATQVLKRNAAAAFDLVSDTVLHPLFGDKDIGRLRNQRQASLTQIKDDPFALAQRVEVRAIYGTNHPYGYPKLGSEAATSATPLTLSQPTFDNSLERHILLVDKPGTPQTALAVSALGVPRSTADYAPLEVANAALGGLFSSRINMNLREKNGYTYGAFSWFDYRRGPGPFTIFSSVRTETTAPALKEIFSEIQKFDAAPVTAAELAMAKDSIARSLAGQFETMPVTVQSTTALFVYELPPDFYRKLPAAVDAVTAAGVQRVANRYFVPEKMVVVAVGDRQKIEEGLKATRLGAIVPTSFEGEPIVAGSPSQK
jgi:zinc protease